MAELTEMEVELRIAAYMEGIEDGYNGDGPDANPFTDVDLSNCWEQGHAEGIVDALEDWEVHVAIREMGLDPADMDLDF